MALTSSEPDIVPVTPRIVTSSRMLEGMSLAASVESIPTVPEPSW